MVPGALLARLKVDQALLEEIDGRAPAAAVRALWEEQHSFDGMAIDRSIRGRSG